MSGFKNAPNITELKRGMEFTEDDQLWRVVIAYGVGAVCLRVGGMETRVYNKACFPHSTLDLDSIWEGREYRLRVDGSGASRTVGITPGATVTVAEPGTHYIVYSLPNREHFSTPRGVFSDVFTPIDPEPEPKAEPPVKVGDRVEIRSQGRFHVGIVDHIDELMGVSIGGGHFDPNTNTITKLVPEGEKPCK